MKKFILIVCIGFLCFSCSEDDSAKSYKSEGTIIGFDKALCGCCGGLILDIENIGYRFFGELPEGSNIDLNNLTKKVKLDWELVPSACDNFISISAIEVVN